MASQGVNRHGHAHDHSSIPDLGHDLVGVILGGSAGSSIGAERPQKRSTFENTNPFVIDDPFECRNPQSMDHTRVP